jgi:hypothetical protein
LNFSESKVSCLGKSRGDTAGGGLTRRRSMCVKGLSSLISYILYCAITSASNEATRSTVKSVVLQRRMVMVLYWFCR